MATSAMPNSNPPFARSGVGSERESTLWASLVTVLKPVASLKLTVGLLALGIALVFIGTLAQVSSDMWTVIARYFDAWICWVPVQVFFPRSWFPNYQDIRGEFPFVGGKSLGLAMLINLFSAHLIRFKLQARGKEIWAGLALFVLGVAVTTWVIVAGQNRGGLQGKPPISWEAMWFVFLAFLTVGSGSMFGLYFYPSTRPVHQKWMCAGASALLAVITLTLFVFGEDFYRDPSKMRILWQLLQAELAALVLLAGANVLFRKRAGIVMIHTGVGLLMLGQLLVNLLAVEERMSIREGETIDYVQDIRAVEMAIVDTSDPERNYVVAVPLIEKGNSTTYVPAGPSDGTEKPGKSVEFTDPRWPFRAEVVKFLRNSTLPRLLDEHEQNLATAGIGAKFTIDDKRNASGTDTDGEVDMATAWVRFQSQDGRHELGTFLLSQTLANMNRTESLTVDGRVFEMTLRFKRTKKPYTVTLFDVHRDFYPGTLIEKNYSSDLRLSDPDRKFDETLKIRMNEPLRYAGETFYQSGFQSLGGGREMTTLQVVTNTGWMIPYVACMIVGTGMVAHFGFVLSRFLFSVVLGQAAGGAGIASWLVAAAGLEASERTSTDASKAATAHPALAHLRPKSEPDDDKRRKREKPHADSPTDADWKWRLLVPAIVVGLFVVLVGYLAYVPKAKIGTFDFFEFGQLPVQEKGRVKPLDTLAINTLRVLSNGETVYLPPPPGSPNSQRGQTLTAIEWLAEMIAETDRSDKLQLFRIENLDVLNLLGLERRAGFRYSVEELGTNIEKFETAADSARKKSKEDLTTVERKLLELDGRLRTYMVVRAAFRPLPIPPMPTEEELQRDPAAAESRGMLIRRMLMSIPEADRQLAAMQPPRAIPAAANRERQRDEAESEAQEKWVPYATAWNRNYLATLLEPDKGADRAALDFEAVVAAYRRGDQEGFNRAVQVYRTLLEDIKPDSYHAADTRFETWFNSFAPFFYMMIFYVLVFVITAFGWLFTLSGWSQPFHRAAFWLAVCTFLIHTMAVCIRVYISGRPPVTNLYSSAIFIGWACALAGVVLELLIRQGIGNTVASFAGFVTLLIAHNLALEGDTVAVMVAVLDTQFWLSTHVVCITLGYSATFVAGLLGAVYVFAGLAPKALAAPTMRRGTTTMPLGRMLATSIYGVLCFAILFSFVGTVLGGLWADDSWGRFWGWDPKENGALIIVLWNAMILHARWDGMVRERGLAVLALGGNIVTCWSWFGVNQLGVGLHSYGFTEGVLNNLMITVAAHLLVIGLAFVPLVFAAWLKPTDESAAPVA